MATPIDRTGPYQWPFMAGEVAMRETMKISRDAWDALSVWRPAPQAPEPRERLDDWWTPAIAARERYLAGKAAIHQAVCVLLGIPPTPPQL